MQMICTQIKYVFCQMNVVKSSYYALVLQKHLNRINNCDVLSVLVVSSCNQSGEQLIDMYIKYCPFQISFALF